MTSKQAHEKIDSVKFMLSMRDNVLGVHYLEAVEQYIAELEVKLNNK
jgi:hypothetical protein|tara:strand:+ start:4662 stop:4802 length:141 start_codon:yes stop_codon:yes gene_type:complete